MTDRRTVLGGGLAMGLFATAGFGANLKGNDMYGLIGKMKATPGKRPDLMAILGEGTGAMPGNLAYIIAEDMADPDGIWVTEAWTDKGAHAASLKLPAVQQAIARARPLIAGFEAQHEIRPVSGIPAHSA
jgi:quinol monooxygenase YgiN